MRLSELKVCEIVGISQQKRQSLVKRELLNAVDRRGCSVMDAVELAAIERLSHHLSPSDIAASWVGLQTQIRSLVPRGRIDVVFDRQLGQARIVRDDEALRGAVAIGRPVQVIELGPRLEEVAEAFQRWAGAEESRGSDDRSNDALRLAKEGTRRRGR